MRRRKILLGLGSGTALATALAGCTSSDDESEPEDGENAGEETEEGEAVDEVVGALIEGEQMHLVIEDVRYETEFGEFSRATDGNEYAVVSLAMKNVSEDFLSVSNLLQTRVHDDEGNSYGQAIAPMDEPTFDDGQFASGEVERDAIVFEVPADASGLELTLEFDVSIVGGVGQAHVDLESETDVHELEQDLQIDVNDVGDAVAVEDTEVSVTDVRYETELGQFTQAEEGHEYAIVDLEITNTTGEAKRVSSVQILAKDDRGVSYRRDLSATMHLERSFDENTELEDGETRRGEVAYEIEAGRSPLYWVFEFGLWTDGDKAFWKLR